MKNVCPYVCQGISLGVQLDDSMGCWEDWSGWVSNDGTMADSWIERNREKRELFLIALAWITDENESKTGDRVTQAKGQLLCLLERINCAWVCDSV